MNDNNLRRIAIEQHNGMRPKSIVHHCDCMDFLREQPTGSFDLAICDPPYFNGPEYFDELKRVARFYIVWGCNYFDYVFHHGRIVWDKCNQSSSFSDCEIAATNLFESVRLFPFMWNGMCQGRCAEDGRTMQGNKKLNEKRIHPTQKPVALYGWLLRNFAKEGWSILDTHLGSGSSRIAAYKMGFDFTGCEIDRYYFEAQELRFKAEALDLSETNSGLTVHQSSIFDCL